MFTNPLTYLRYLSCHLLALFLLNQLSPPLFTYYVLTFFKVIHRYPLSFSSRSCTLSTPFFSALLNEHLPSLLSAPSYSFSFRLSPQSTFMSTFWTSTPHGVSYLSLPLYTVIVLIHQPTQAQILLYHTFPT